MTDNPCACKESLWVEDCEEKPGSPLSLELNSSIQMRMRLMESPLSEYSFANLYLFREKHEYRFIDKQEISYLRGKTYDGARFLMPLHDPLRGGAVARDRLVRELEEDEWIYPVTEDWLGIFPEDVFERETRREDDDYLYPAEQMRDLPGKKLHKKRNLIKQFRRDYSSQAVSLDQLSSRDILYVLDQWQEDMGAETADTDYDACREAVELREELGLQGIGFQVENRLAGFLLYEDLPQGVRVVHFAKGLKGIKGLYPAMFQEAAREMVPGEDRDGPGADGPGTDGPGTAWLNLEQDLGIPALRQNKESYRPARREPKYRVRPRRTPR